MTIINVNNQRILTRRHFSQEINETAWMADGRIVVTRGNGTVEIISSDTLETIQNVPAHPSNCYCLAVDPSRRYFAVGAADALVSLWEYGDLVCTRTFARLDWPIRAVGFSGDGEWLAMAAEDLFVEVADVRTGETVHRIPTTGAVNTLAWNPDPNQPILVYAGDQNDSPTHRSLSSLHVVDYH